MSDWSGLDKVAVYICTTDGPIRIERISNEPAALSEVFVGRGVTAVMPMSDDYEEFVRDHRPVAKAFGPFPYRAFRMDIDRPVQTGNSWHLASFIAHGLAKEGRLAGPDDKVKLALFLTGTVDADFCVGPVGHLSEKWAALSDQRQEYEANNVPVGFFAPEGDQSFSDALGFTPLASAMDLMDQLVQPGVQTGQAGEVSQPAYSMKWLAGIVAVSALIGGGVWALMTGTGTSDHGSVQLLERLAPENKTCASIQFGDETPVLKRVTFNGDGQAYSSLEGLCGLRLIVEGVENGRIRIIPETGRFVDFERNEEGRGVPIDHPFAGRFEMDLDIPRRLPDGLEYRIELDYSDKKSTFFHYLNR